MEEGINCPYCEKGKLQKPKYFISTFEKIKQPDFICDYCGKPDWKLPEPQPPPQISKKEVEKIEEPEKFDWTKYI